MKTKPIREISDKDNLKLVIESMQKEITYLKKKLNKLQKHYDDKYNVYLGDGWS